MLLALLLVLTGDCARPGLGPAVGVHPGWPLAGKARVAEGGQAMVVSGSPLASEVGRDILQAGGNAVDAAVAVGFALAVVHPEAGNLGGGGFMLIRTSYGAVAALDYRETAPAAASHDMYLNRQGEPTALSDKGHLAAGVPGSVAGLVEAHRRFGRLPLRQVMEPAVHLAEDGFIVDEYRSRSIDEYRAWLYTYPASRRYFLPDSGQAPAPGSRWEQRDLGRTLRAIQHRGAAGFYTGWVADSIVAEMKRGGGLISREDLADYQAIWREPIKISYRGYTIYSMPPASSGGVTLALILNIMEGLQPAAPVRLPRVTAPRGRGDATRVHGSEYLSWGILASCACRWTGSCPRSTPRPSGIRSCRAAPPRPRRSTPLCATAIPPPTTLSWTPRATSVSCTTTLNDSYGSAVAVSGAGFLLNDEMDDFATAPGKPNIYGLVQGEANAIQPGKRMLSAMTPSIVLDPERQAVHGGGHAGRPDDHHPGLPCHLERDRPWHAAAGRGGRAQDAPPGAARRHAASSGPGFNRRPSGPWRRWGTRSRRAAGGVTSRQSSGRQRAGRVSRTRGSAAADRGTDVERHRERSEATGGLSREQRGGSLRVRSKGSPAASAAKLS